jgi:hypothetical protein
VKEARSNASAKLGALAWIVVWWSVFATAQDLAPRAYVITPLHSNAMTLTWSFYDGGLNFNAVTAVSAALTRTCKWHGSTRGLGSGGRMPAV